MRCIACDAAAVSERPELTDRGYRRFRCRARGKQFNERSGRIPNRAQYPSDVIALVVFWRLRYKLSLRDLSEMFLIRGIEFSHEAVRDWEAKLTPSLIDSLRGRRKGRIGKSWYVDETYIKVQGPLALPVPRDRSLRCPCRREAERDPRHGGGESVLSISQSSNRRHSRACHDGWTRQLSARDPHRTGQRSETPDQPVFEQSDRAGSSWDQRAIRTDARLQEP